MGGLQPASPSIRLLNRLTRFGHQPDLYLAFIEIRPGDLRDLCLNSYRQSTVSTGSIACQGTLSRSGMKKGPKSCLALRPRIGLGCQTSYQLPDATTYTTTR
jgi:hypothetical protein